VNVTRGYPDYQRGVIIVGQELPKLLVDIVAQTIEQLKVNIAAQDLPKLAVDIIAQTLANLNVNLAKQTLDNLNINLNAQTLEAVTVLAPSAKAVNIAVLKSVVTAREYFSIGPGLTDTIISLTGRGRMATFGGYAEIDVSASIGMYLQFEHYIDGVLAQTNVPLDFYWLGGGQLAGRIAELGAAAGWVYTTALNPRGGYVSAYWDGSNVVKAYFFVWPDIEFANSYRLDLYNAHGTGTIEGYLVFLYGFYL